MKDAIRGIFEFFDTDRKGYINASQMRFVEINFSLSTLKKYFDNIKDNIIQFILFLNISLVFLEDTNRRVFSKLQLTFKI